MWMYLICLMSTCLLFIPSVPASVCSDNCDPVYGCDNVTGECVSCIGGWYGNTCNQSCSTNCFGISNQCEISSGSCTNGCDWGWHGDNCSESCGESCRICNRTNGVCTVCETGRWGINCSHICNDNCDGCELETGVCQACKPTYWGQSCSQNCTENCISCNQDDGLCISCNFGFYGDNCTKKCGSCKYGFCDKSNGICLGSTCTDGWFGTRCDQACMTNCSQCTDNVTCSSCIDGLSGTDCSVTCPENCRHCSNDGAGCYLCEDGYKVPTHNCTCSDKKCTAYDTVSNECIECENGTGWYLTFGTCCPCQHCEGGIEQCSPTGQCLKGCEPGYYMDFSGCAYWCDIPHCIWCRQRYNMIPDPGCIGCEKGWYISNHICKPCSDNCIESTCHNDNGVCKYGCLPGWYGDDCSDKCDSNCIYCNRTDGTCTSCPLGKWGLHCENSCPVNCTSCAVDTGACHFCQPGLYGENCTQTCENCKQSFCLVTSGECVFGCREGWFGDRCENECLPNCSYCDNNITCSSCVDGWGGDMCDVRCPDTCVRCSLGKYCSECKAEQKIPSFNCTCSDARCTKYGYSSLKNTTVCTECNATGWFNLFDTCCPCLHCLGGQEKCLPSGKCEDGCEPGWYLEVYGCVERCDIPHCVWCEQRHGHDPDVICVGCEDGWYVADHKCVPCSDNCSGSSCDNRTGACTYRCDAGWYGDKCTEKCDPKCVSCDRRTGECLRCSPGRWGTNCVETCSTNCDMSVCHETSGKCLNGCRDGWYGDRCEESCIPNCLSCYDNKTCSSCLSGWSGDTCDVECPVNCHRCDGARCVACKDGYSMPTLNCICNHTKCSKFESNKTSCAECEQGTGWYLYNGTCCPCLHCLGGSGKCMSNGTCEDGCEPGWFSESFGCAFACSDKCGGSGDECDIKSGKCLNGCDRGWSGDFCNIPCDHRCLECNNATSTCNTCLNGTWGPLCEHDCPSSCPVSCGTSTGFCIECVGSKYGNHCELNCSQNCMAGPNGSLILPSCDFITGHCLNGCVLGWHGDLCNLECSKNCLGNVCKRMNGECLNGCIEGWIGTYCSDKVIKETDTSRLNTAAVVGGTVAGVIVLLVVVVILMLFIKRRTTKYDLD